VTSEMGLHYIFGAFALGFVAGRPSLARLSAATVRICGWIAAVLLPLYLVVPGTTTDFRALDLHSGGEILLVIGAAATPKLPAGLVQSTIFYPQVGLAAAIAIVAGTLWLRPKPRLPWLLFAAGQALFAIGDLLFGVYANVLHDDSFPSPADWLYLAGYPALAAGLWLLVRQRSSGRDAGSL